MTQNNLYINDFTGEVVTHEKYHATMMLLKLLYKMRILGIEQTIEIAEKFKILFV